MTPKRVDWLRFATWTAIGVMLIIGAVALYWQIERFIARYGPWITAHADIIFAVVVTVCIIALAVLAAAERAKKDNPSW